MSKREKNGRSVGGKDDHGRGEGELAEAARALERELLRFEELAESARRLSLDTRKGIERAAKSTTEAAEAQQRVSVALGSLIAAIAAARDRHEATATALAARGEEIKRRAEQLGELFQRFAALGEEGRGINQLVQETAARQRDATSPEQIGEVVTAMDEVEGRMARLADDARELAQAATAAGIVDLAEQADGMRQQVAAMRNKVGLLRKGMIARLSGGAPPN
ncbi:hypothetical protein WME89_37770 [Sorangium sp. So ce321]|uniref:hypothetical protein n=1 Tax=Sorangium sp. So ce321 TaxID=3133300 RepID=UPI003F5E939B